MIKYFVLKWINFHMILIWLIDPFPFFFHVLCVSPAFFLLFSSYLKCIYLIFLYLFQFHTTAFLSFCICTSVGTSEPCTSASRAADRRRTSDASTGPWCTSMPMSTYSVYWRHFWRALHSWCFSSASWSRRTGPKLCSVRSASRLCIETVDICMQRCLCVTDVIECVNVGKTGKYYTLFILFSRNIYSLRFLYFVTVV